VGCVIVFRSKEMRDSTFHRLTTFHAKRSSTQMYFLIVEPLCKRTERTVFKHTFFNAKRDSTWVYNFPCEAMFHMSWQFSTRSLMQTYVSNFWIVEPLVRREEGNLLHSRIQYKARFHIGLQITLLCIEFM